MTQQKTPLYAPVREIQGWDTAENPALCTCQGDPGVGHSRKPRSMHLSWRSRGGTQQKTPLQYKWSIRFPAKQLQRLDLNLASRGFGPSSRAMEANLVGGPPLGVGWVFLLHGGQRSRGRKLGLPLIVHIVCTVVFPSCFWVQWHLGTVNTSRLDLGAEEGNFLAVQLCKTTKFL